MALCLSALAQKPAILIQTNGEQPAKGRKHEISFNRRPKIFETIKTNSSENEIWSKIRDRK